MKYGSLKNNLNNHDKINIYKKKKLTRHCSHNNIVKTRIPFSNRFQAKVYNVSVQFFWHITPPHINQVTELRRCIIHIASATILFRKEQLIFEQTLILTSPTQWGLVMWVIWETILWSNTLGERFRASQCRARSITHLRWCF